MSEDERLGGAGKIMEKGLFPPEMVNVVSWMSSPDLWGVVVVLEADTVDQVIWAIAVWRAAVPGFFKLTKTAPAMAVQELILLGAEISQAVNS